MHGGYIQIENKEIITHLKALGLDIGATPEDIRASFRRLARELHPDVTGSKSDFRFKQITGAYNALKSLTAEELEALAQSDPAYAYIRAEREREEAARRAAEKIDAIIDRYERDIKDYYTNKPSEDRTGIDAITFRLKSRNPKVIGVALKHSGHLVNRIEFRKAITELLKRPEIDEASAEAASVLPFDDMTRKLLALDVAGNSQNFPAGLIISLIGNDTDVMESFLLHVKPENTAVILRRWPSGKSMNMNVLRTLLANDDANILVPLLSAMKANFPGAAMDNKKRLAELEHHYSAAVRAWAKKLV